MEFDGVLGFLDTLETRRIFRLSNSPSNPTNDLLASYSWVPLFSTSLLHNPFQRLCLRPSSRRSNPTKGHYFPIIHGFLSPFLPSPSPRPISSNAGHSSLRNCSQPSIQPRPKVVAVSLLLPSPSPQTIWLIVSSLSLSILHQES